MNSQIDVSVVVVCMNNLDNLYPCLDSIYKTTMLAKIEVLVVAYLFSQKNFNDLKQRYPQVLVIESNEIRGFSENNNLALKQARGSYAFILNDDTYFNDAIIDTLLDDFENVPPECAVISPSIYHVNYKRRAIGYLPVESFAKFCFRILGFPLPRSKKDLKYINQKGLFQSYAFSGCAFMIKMRIFQKLAFFDEQYFFTPEDIVLSKLVNDSGYTCYVDANVELNHLQQTTFSKTSTATFPASIRGTLIFRSENFFVYKIMLRILLLFKFSVVILLLFTKKTSIENDIAIKRYRNAIYALFSCKSPKELFVKFYKNKYE